MLNPSESVILLAKEFMEYYWSPCNGNCAIGTWNNCLRYSPLGPTFTQLFWGDFHDNFLNLSRSQSTKMLNTFCCSLKLVDSLPGNVLIFILLTRRLILELTLIKRWQSQDSTIPYLNFILKSFCQINCLAFWFAKLHCINRKHVG